MLPQTTQDPVALAAAVRSDFPAVVALQPGRVDAEETDRKPDRSRVPRAGAGFESAGLQLCGLSVVESRAGPGVSLFFFLFVFIFLFVFLFFSFSIFHFSFSDAVYSVYAWCLLRILMCLANVDTTAMRVWMGA